MYSNAMLVFVITNFSFFIDLHRIFVFLVVLLYGIFVMDIIAYLVD